MSQAVIDPPLDSHRKCDGSTETRAPALVDPVGKLHVRDRRIRRLATLLSGRLSIELAERLGRLSGPLECALCAMGGVLAGQTAEDHGLTQVAAPVVHVGEDGTKLTADEQALDGRAIVLHDLRKLVATRPPMVLYIVGTRRTA